MGQIIQLPLSSAAYPDTAAALDPAEHVLLTAIRWWVDACRRDEDPMPRLFQGLEMAGMCDAAISLDAWMAIIARTVQQPIAIHCPRCADLSDDKRHLLHAPASPRSATAFSHRKRSAPPCSPGKARNLPWVPCRELFAETGWFFRQRRPPVVDRPPTAAVEPWVPSTFLATVTDQGMVMERHFSTGVATIVQLMAANRAASGRADLQFGAGEEIYFDANAEADLLAEHAIPRDVVGDWLLHLATALHDE